MNATTTARQDIHAAAHADWERGIHEPWRPIEDQAWIDELDAMLEYGEIIQVPHSHEIKEA